jgi:hypothetical protein
MSDRTARLAVMLALIPGAFGVFVTVVETRAPHFGQHLFKDFSQFAFLITSILTLALAVRLWRDYVQWNKSRISITAIICVGVVIYALAWYPIITSRWQQDWVCIAQGFVLSALCWAALARLWWGSSPEPDQLRSKSMSFDASRLALSIALVPLYAGMHTLLEFWFGRPYSMADGRAYATALSSAAVVALWIVVWRRRVAWSGIVVVVTAMLALFALVSPITMTSPVLFHIWWPLRHSTPFLALAAWFAGTAWLWRNRESSTLIAAPDSDQIRCPQCSYSLKGLREVHCPECGWESTIDELVRVTMARAEEV